jgi:hypothetical protein
MRPACWHAPGMPPRPVGRIAGEAEPRPRSPPRQPPARRSAALGGVQHLAALGGEVVDVLLHRALVVAPVAHLASDQLLAVLSADDGGDPVAEPAGQNLDGVGGVLCAVRDRVRAFDGNGADGARNAVALVVESRHGQERRGIPPGRSAGLRRSPHSTPTGRQADTGERSDAREIPSEIAGNGGQADG